MLQLLRRIQSAVVADFEEEEEEEEVAPRGEYAEIAREIEEFFPGREMRGEIGARKRAVEAVVEEIRALDAERDEVDTLRAAYARAAAAESAAAACAERARKENAECARLSGELSGERCGALQTDEETERERLSGRERERDEAERRNGAVRMRVRELRARADADAAARAAVEAQLAAERREYEETMAALSAFQRAAPADGGAELRALEERVAEGEREVAALMDSAAAAAGALPELEAEAREVAARYAELHAEEEKEGESDGSGARDESVYISNLLVEYYKGDEGALGRLREMFGWTDSEMETLRRENRGLAGFLNRGKRYFNGFRDLWTGWLISASESG